MPTPSATLQALLTRYEQGSSTPAERAWLERWYEQLETDGAQSILDDPQARQQLLELMWEDLEKKTRPAVIPLWPRIRVAAAVMVLLVGGGLLWRYQRSARSSPLADIQMSTGIRQVKMVVLPDSSIVWLNAASALHYSPTIDRDGIRRVTLTEGEAFFDIRQDAARPFEVVSPKGVRTIVLGTSFDVRAYTNDDKMSVAVVTGKVQVNEAGVLTAGQGFSITGKGAAALTFDRYVTNLGTGWRMGQLEFDNAAIMEIAHTLERWFKVRVNVDPNTLQSHDRYNARFNKGASLEEVLRLLSATNGLRYKMTGDSLRLYSKPMAH